MYVPCTDNRASSLVFRLTLHLFPLNSSSHSMNKRKKAKYKVNHARSERYKRSPVIYMQNLLNHNFVNDEICAEGGPRFEREEQDREVEGKELPCM